MNIQKGFTLIELVVVLIMLGILAAVALPKFANMGTEARIVMVKNLEDSLRSSVESANAKAQLNSVNLNAANQFVDWNDDGDNTDGNGVDLRLDFGYPEENANGIDLLIKDLGDFSISTASGLRQFVLSGITNCMVTYDQSTGAGVDPVLARVTTGC